MLECEHDEYAAYFALSTYMAGNQSLLILHIHDESHFQIYQKFQKSLPLFLDTVGIASKAISLLTSSMRIVPLLTKSGR